MIRALMLIAMALTLSGCLTAEERARMAAEQNAADDAKCQSYGAKPGTDIYVTCRMRVVEQRQEEERAAGQRAEQGLRNAGAALQSVYGPSTTVRTDCERFGSSISCTSR
jgi:hypothetical protein